MGVAGKQRSEARHRGQNQKCRKFHTHGRPGPDRPGKEVVLCPESLKNFKEPQSNGIGFSIERSLFSRQGEEWIGGDRD